MSIYNVVRKLQSLSDFQKIIIISSVVGIFGLGLGYFWVQSAKANLGKIIQSTGSIDLPDINLQSEELERLPSVNDVLNSEEGRAMVEALENADESQTDTADWKTYANAQYGFKLEYPNDWLPDQAKSGDLELHLLKEVDGQQSRFDMEVVSQTQKITSAENAIDKIVKRMKEVVSPKEKIIIGDDIGYEAIGTLCTAVCDGSSADVYSLLSIVYFSHGNHVFYLDYIEGKTGQKWEDDMDNWNYYDEYKDIISSIVFTDSKESN